MPRRRDNARHKRMRRKIWDYTADKGTLRCMIIRNHEIGKWKDRTLSKPRPQSNRRYLEKQRQMSEGGDTQNNAAFFWLKRLNEARQIQKTTRNGSMMVQMHRQEVSPDLPQDKYDLAHDADVKGFNNPDAKATDFTNASWL